MSAAMTTQALTGCGMVPALSETADTIEDETRQAFGPEGRGVWYDGLLLAVSFTLLLLGLLPLEKKGPQGTCPPGCSR